MSPYEGGRLMKGHCNNMSFFLRIQRGNETDFVKGVSMLQLQQPSALHSCQLTVFYIVQGFT